MHGKFKFVPRPHTHTGPGHLRQGGVRPAHQAQADADAGHARSARPRGGERALRAPCLHGAHGTARTLVRRAVATLPPPASAPLRKRPPPRGGHGLSPWLQATPGGGQLLGSEHFSSHSFTALKRGAVRMLAGQNLSPLCRFCGCQEGACPPRRGRDVVSTRQGPCRRSGTYERQQALIGQIKRYAEISPEVSAVTSGEQSLRL